MTNTLKLFVFRKFCRNNHVFFISYRFNESTTQNACNILYNLFQLFLIDQSRPRQTFLGIVHDVGSSQVIRRHKHSLLIYREILTAEREKFKLHRGRHRGADLSHEIRSTHSFSCFQILKILQLVKNLFVI